MTATLQVGSRICRCGRGQHATSLVVLTGGPGAGKTAVLEMARHCFCAHVGILPEAAGIVFGGGFPRHTTGPGLRAAQRAIFHVQREVETLVTEESQVAVGLCDRGTIDGIAYWPDQPEPYWQQFGTTLDEEIARYAAVIHLQTPAAEHGYNHDNALRVESAKEARSIDERIMAAWSAHPRRFVVPSSVDFSDKAMRALAIVRDELPECCHGHEIHQGTNDEHR